MRLNSGKILGINITFDSRETILEEIKKYLFFSPQPSVVSHQKRQKPLVIVTPNPEQIVLAQHDTQFREILNQADVAIPDGTGIIFATRFLNGKWQMANGKWKLNRIAGVDFMEDLVSVAAKQGVRIGLIGGRGGVAVRALECLSTEYPKLRGWAEDGPQIEIKSTNLQMANLQMKGLQIYKSTNNLQKEIHIAKYCQKLAQRVKKMNTRMVFVGLGAPKQEYFIEALSHQLSAIRKSEDRRLKTDDCVLMSVGGSFDIIAGKIQRAPLFVRKIGFEWVWRLLHEPWRIRRQLALLQYVFLVLREKVRTR